MNNMKMFLNLNETDYKIIHLILKNYTNENISNECFLSFGSTKDRIAKIFKQIKVNSRTELAIKFIKLNILEDICLLRSKQFNSDNILNHIEKTLIKEIQNNDRLYKTRNQKDTRFKIIAGQFSKRSCKDASIFVQG